MVEGVPICIVNVDVANKIIIKNFVWVFENATLAYKLIKNIIFFYKFKLKKFKKKKTFSILKIKEKNL